MADLSSFLGDIVLFVTYLFSTSPSPLTLLTFIIVSSFYNTYTDTRNRADAITFVALLLKFYKIVCSFYVKIA